MAEIIPSWCPVLNNEDQFHLLNANTVRAGAASTVPRRGNGVAAPPHSAPLARLTRRPERKGSPRIRRQLETSCRAAVRLVADRKD
jgi:hypothetical protein